METQSPVTTASSPLALNMDTDGDGDLEGMEMVLQPGNHRDIKRPNLTRSNMAGALYQSNAGLAINSTTTQGYSRPMFDGTASDDSQDCEGESPGLDALAMAARMSG